MSNTIIGKTLTYALEDAVERQKEINNTLTNSNPKDHTTILLNEQTELLEQLLMLCKRVY
jgi:hypothetical protein